MWLSWFSEEANDSAGYLSRSGKQYVRVTAMVRMSLELLGRENTIVVDHVCDVRRAKLYYLRGRTGKAAALHLGANGPDAHQLP